MHNSLSASESRYVQHAWYKVATYDSSVSRTVLRTTPYVDKWRSQYTSIKCTNVMPIIRKSISTIFIAIIATGECH